MNKKFVKELGKRLHNQMGQPVLVLYAEHAPAIGFVSGRHLEINKLAGSVAIPTRKHIVYDCIAQRASIQPGGIPLGGIVYSSPEAISKKIFFGIKGLSEGIEQIQQSLRELDQHVVNIVRIGDPILEPRASDPRLVASAERELERRRRERFHEIDLVRAVQTAAALLKSRHAL